MHCYLSWYNLGTLLKDLTGNTLPTWAKMIPHLRIKNLKNYILFCCTYLYNPYMGVPPPGGDCPNWGWWSVVDFLNFFLYFAFQTECKASKHYPNPQRVNGLKVDFITSKPSVKIGWQPIDPSTTSKFNLFWIRFWHLPVFKTMALYCFLKNHLCKLFLQH